ncbi:MAG TPA: hypothetical protein ENK66_01005 [Arcobacter sp.]|nr:hypothetical protein [Arcobacter sp.]
MAIRCEEEFNPWPAFVDIFSAVILVLMLFLLVTLVNIGYYAQFKYKIQYTGTVATDELILQDTTKKVELEEQKQQENQDSKKIVVENLTDEPIEQSINQELQLATDIESAGEDLADVKKADDPDRVQKILEDDRFFYISFKDTELFVDQPTTEKLKTFIKNVQSKYPGAKLSIMATDPLDQISITITKQMTLGRSLGVRNLIRKFEYERKDIKLQLQRKPEQIPEDFDIEKGLVVIEVLSE